MNDGTQSRVHRLDDGTINKIAAGEVVERPASVVKELVENSIDAGASRIEVEIRNGGRQYVRVTDNGFGMDREDAVLAIERHTTSKISEAEELWTIRTLGFRGEALPSIAAVSQFEIITKPPARETGTCIEVRGGYIKRVKDTGAPDGTTIKVQDLFFNTPARMKYLKSIPTEAGYISELVSRLALGYPEISFRLQHHEYEMVFTSGSGEITDAIVSIFGKDLFHEMIPFELNENSFSMRGFIGKPSIARTNRNYEIFFVNRRYFHSRVISSAVEKAFHTLLPIARYPFIILFVDVDPSIIDVNAHPTKLEVRFSNESDLFKTVFHAVRNTLREQSLLAEWTAAPDSNPFTESFHSSSVKHNDLGLKSTAPISETSLNQASNLTFSYHEFTETKNQTASVREPSADFGAFKNESFPETEIVGRSEDDISNVYIFPKTVVNTYIIIQDDKGLLFVDQHAAHERVLYEKYISRNQEFLGAQNLLIPETLNLTYPQYKVVQDRLSLFAQIGYEMEAFGGQTVIMRTVPLVLANLDYRQILLEMVEQYINFETFKNPAEIKEAFLITMACRTAVKAGDKLDPLELEGLIKDLFKCENSYTCPHGRPTFFRMSLDEIAKKFLRRPR